jgi:putative membrane protein insertion efficiency factor
MAIGAIHLYQRVVTPITARVGMRCRFTPSCSHYGEQIIAREGLLLGGLKTAQRVARCGPWTAHVTRDEP